MKDTKDRILDKSLELFNEKGTDVVTVRMIAAELGISHGNLCYHFTNTDTIIYSLYQRLVEDLNVVIGQAEVKEPDLLMVLGMGKKVMVLLNEYRFLMLDFVRIMRRIPQIKDHFQALARERKVQFKNIIESLIGTGYFKPEVIPGQYEKLIEINQIIGDFWIASAEILYVNDGQDALSYYMELMAAHFIPCLTEKGLQQYLNFFRNGSASGIV